LDCTTPVASLATSTEAPAITAPLRSETCPVNCEVWDRNTGHITVMVNPSQNATLIFEYMALAPYGEDRIGSSLRTSISLASTGVKPLGPILSKNLDRFK